MTEGNATSTEDICAKVISRDIDPDQGVGIMSGGEPRAIAIARAVHFGARFLTLDEPTAAHRVRKAEVVIDPMERTKQDGTGFADHAYPIDALAVGDKIAVPTQGRSSISSSEESGTTIRSRT